MSDDNVIKGNFLKIDTRSVIDAGLRALADVPWDMPLVAQLRIMFEHGSPDDVIDMYLRGYAKAAAEANPTSHLNRELDALHRGLRPDKPDDE